MQLKRLFDIVFAIILLLLTSGLLIIGIIISAISTRSSGIFVQERVGQFGKPFYIIKLKTMRSINNISTTISTSKDPRITTIGKILRLLKIDELPQLINIVKGDMSFVGPRADVQEYIDKINQEDKKIILSVKPGLISPATLKYINEEEILARQNNPEEYYLKYIFPDKIRLNKEYVLNYSFIKDIYYIFITVVYMFKKWFCKI